MSEVVKVETPSTYFVSMTGVPLAPGHQGTSVVCAIYSRIGQNGKLGALSLSFIYFFLFYFEHLRNFLLRYMKFFSFPISMLS